MWYRPRHPPQVDTPSEMRDGAAAHLSLPAWHIGTNRSTVAFVGWVHVDEDNRVELPGCGVDFLRVSHG